MAGEMSVAVRGTKQLASAAKKQKSTSSFVRRLRQQQHEQSQRWAEPNTPFPVGQRKVYLPSFRVILQYSPFVPATHAQFQVPLHFSKLDLRDYLWHTYKIASSSIRSQVVLQPIRFVEKGSFRDVPGQKNAYRPQSLKRMIVRLEKPFVWPEREDEAKENEIFNTATGKKIKASEQEMRKRGRSSQAVVEDEEFTRQMQALTKRANSLLSGREQWKGETTSRWGASASDSPGARTSKPSASSSSTDADSEDTQRVVEPTAHEKRVLAKAKMLRDAGIAPELSTRTREGRRRTSTV